MCVPETELNYAVLHNNGLLFRQFVVERGNARATDWFDIDIELQLGAEPARYRRRFVADRTRFDLTGEVHVPLTATLMRGLQEAVNGTLVVQLSHNDRPLDCESHRLRLLPVDQWRDNDKDGPTDRGPATSARLPAFLSRGLAAIRWRASEQAGCECSTTPTGRCARHR